jgi:hypothetical protein
MPGVGRLGFGNCLHANSPRDFLEKAARQPSISSRQIFFKIHAERTCILFAISIISRQPTPIVLRFGGELSYENKDSSSIRIH